MGGLLNIAGYKEVAALVLDVFQGFLGLLFGSRRVGAIYVVIVAYLHSSGGGVFIVAVQELVQPARRPPPKAVPENGKVIPQAAQGSEV